MYGEGSFIDIQDSTINSNMAQQGGHLFLDLQTSVIMQDSMAQYAQGGAAWIKGGGSLTCTHTTNNGFAGFFSNYHSPGGAINIIDDGSFLGENCDMGIDGQVVDNFDSDIAIWSGSDIIIWQEANNDTNIICDAIACNYY